jgi:hypothetical protein
MVEIKSKFFQNSRNKNEKAKRLIKKFNDEKKVNHDEEISLNEFSFKMRNILILNFILYNKLLNF